MDVIAAADEKYQYHLKQAEKWRLFKEQALELARDNGAQAAPGVPITPPTTRARTAPKSGAIYDTAVFIRGYMREHGEGQITRDLLAVAHGGGLDIGGNNPVATLSARLSSSQMFVLRGGKWFIRQGAE